MRLCTKPACPCCLFDASLPIDMVGVYSSVAVLVQHDRVRGALAPFCGVEAAKGYADAETLTWVNVARARGLHASEVES